MSEARGTIAETDSKSSEEKENSGEGSQPDTERSNTALADLDKGLRGLDDTDEDLAEVIANNWQRVVGGLVLCLLAVWIYNQYQAANRNRQFAASESYTNVQAAYQSVIQQSAAPTIEGREEETSKDIEKNKTLLSENVRLLKSSDKDSVLTNFAEIYEAKFLIDDKKYTEADSLLKPIIERGKQEMSKTSQVAVAGGIASLLSARALIVQNNTESANKILYSLLQDGGIASVEAAVILASLASSQEDRTKIVTAAKNASSSHPSLAEELSQELKKFGIVIE